MGILHIGLCNARRCSICDSRSATLRNCGTRGQADKLGLWQGPNPVICSESGATVLFKGHSSH